MEKINLRSVSPNLKELLKKSCEWDFDILALRDLTDNQPLRYLSYYIFKVHGCMSHFEIDDATMQRFLSRMEDGCNRYNNPFHNSTHVADTMQTVHSILKKTNILLCLSEVEVFALFLACVMHNFDHAGHTNSFDNATESERALIYNDISVNQNHQISKAFRITREPDFNIFLNVSPDVYRQLRRLIIELALSVDMDYHFKLQHKLKTLVFPGSTEIRNSLALSQIFHCSKISQPTKSFSLQQYWVGLLQEERFNQGDEERKRRIPMSLYSDRYHTKLHEAQVGFLEYVIKPSFTVLTKMIEVILMPFSSDSQTQIKSEIPWFENIYENLEKWKEIERVAELEAKPKKFTHLK